MNKNELDALFSDFKKQVNDISEHSDKVHKLNFNCTLDNGTGFKFNYDKDKYNKDKEPTSYKPATTFNAIVDIISAVASITFLVLFLINRFNFNYTTTNLTNILFTLIIILAISFFVIRAIYHLFHVTSNVRDPLFRTSEAIKIAILVSLNILVSIIYNVKAINIVIFTSFILSALSLLCFGICTKLSIKIAMFFSSILPFLMLVSSLNSDLIYASIILCISSLIYIFVNNKEAKTNSIFMFLGICLIFLNFLILV